MINFKQAISKSLLYQHCRPFSQARLRNFFELDPIFPDAHDPDRHLDIKRFSFHSILAKEEKQKTRFYEHALATANRNIQERARLKYEAEQKVKKTNPRQERRDTLRHMGESILTDPDFKLPYGFGFDEYINQLKARNLSSASQAFLVNLNNLFKRLEYINDIELVAFHREAIVQRTKKDFKERASGIILGHIVNQIKRQRENKSVDKEALSKLVSDPAILEKAAASSEINEELLKEIQEKLDPKRLDNASANLANEALTERIKINKNIREGRREKDIDELFHEALFEETVDNEPIYNEFEWMLPKEYGENVVGMNDAQFNSYQIANEIRTKYLQRKAKVINEVYLEESEDMPENEEIVPVDDLEAKEQQEEKESDQDIQNQEENEFSGSEEELYSPEAEAQRKLKYEKFAQQFLGDPELENLERKAGVHIRKAPTLQEVYEDIHKIIENAPLSLKKKLDSDPQAENVNFKPQFSNLSINPMEFLWGDVSQLLHPILPNYQNEQLRTVKDIVEGFAYTGERQLTGDFSMPAKEKKPPTAPEFEPDAVFDVKEITPELEKEMELFRHVRKDPYFRHSLTNELRYYSDRMNDHFAALYAGISMNQHTKNDYYEFDLPEARGAPPALRKEIKLEATKYHGQSYGCGRRKTATALAIVKDGNGLININRKSFVDYFGQVSMRQLVVEPLMVSGYSFSLDVSLFIWGGGMHAQAEAAQIAVAKALSKFNPILKPVMRQTGLMIRDKRYVERKKVGLYKARKKYPYIRR